MSSRPRNPSNTMTPTPRHICKVALCPARRAALRLVLMPAARTAVQEAWLPWAELPLSGLASLQVEEQVADGSRLTKATLTAPLRCNPAGFGGEPLCLRLTDDAGRHWLLGSGAQPHPLVTLHLSSADGKARTSVEAQWESPLPLCRLVAP